MKSASHALLLLLVAMLVHGTSYGQITGNVIQYTYGNPGVCGSISFTAGDVIHGSVAPNLAGGTAYTYQWNASINTGTTYTLIAGATNADYFPGTITQTTAYTRTVTSGTLTSISNAILLEVEPIPISGNSIYINADKSSEHDIPCGTPSYSPGLLTYPGYPSAPALSGGRGSNYGYQWFFSTDNGSTYTAAKDGTGKPGNAYTFIPAAITQTTWFVRVVHSGACSDQSPPIKFVFGGLVANNTIKAPAITSACGSSSYTPQNISGSALPAGYTYQWQSGPDSSNFTDITGATSQSISPAPISSTTAYRRTAISSGGCKSYTNSVVISVAPPFSSNVISAGQTVNAGVTPAQLTGAAVSSGANSITYTWQVSSDSTSNYTTAGGVSVMQDYQPGPLTTTAYFRRVASSGACNSVSNVIGIHVAGVAAPCTTPNVISATQTVDSAKTPSPLTGNVVTPTAAGTITYTWQISSDAKTFTPAPGVNNTQNYQPPIATKPVFFNRVASTGTCNSISDTVAILINGQKAPATCLGAPSSADMGSSLIHKPGTKTTGASYDYTLSATNYGPDDATNVVVRDTLPANVTYFSATADKGTGTYDKVTRILTWNVGPLRKKVTTQLIMTVIPLNNDQIITRLGITATQCDPDLANNSRRDTINDPLPVFNEKYIPDIITPNGDGKNDTWVIKEITTKAFSNNSVLIFDRWGNTVFSASGYQNNWDGSGLVNGTYFYVLKINNSETTLNYKGYITLMR